MAQDPLVLIPMERWSEIQDTFKTDWPRGILGLSLLDTQKAWEDEGVNYGLQVYCPFGDVWDGMVGVNIKGNVYELFIQCPKDDTSKLEEALKKTKLIDWSQTKISVSVAPQHIVNANERLAKHFEKDMTAVYMDTLILKPEEPLFDVRLPQGITFKLLSPEHAELVDSKWPHRYPGSVKYLQLMIEAKSAYGLFDNDKLVTWMFVAVAGFFNILYTLEDHRRKGYAELLVKLMSNFFKKEKKTPFCFIVKGNEDSFRLFEKLKFCKAGEVAWCFLEGKEGAE